MNIHLYIIVEPHHPRAPELCSFQVLEGHHWENTSHLKEAHVVYFQIFKFEYKIRWPQSVVFYATSDFYKKRQTKIPYSVLINSNTDVVMCWCPCGWGALVGPNYGSVLHNYSQGCPDNQKADLLDSLHKESSVPSQSDKPQPEQTWLDQHHTHHTSQYQTTKIPQQDL